MFHFFRGSDGTLYIDNVGSKVIRETETELDIKTFLDVDWFWRREEPPPVLWW